MQDSPFLQPQICTNSQLWRRTCIVYKHINTFIQVEFTPRETHAFVLFLMCFSRKRKEKKQKAVEGIIPETIELFLEEHFHTRPFSKTRIEFFFAFKTPKHIQNDSYTFEKAQRPTMHVILFIYFKRAFSL